MNIHSLSLLESSSYTTLVNAAEPCVPQQAIPFDDDDVFQCGRCKRQFTSLSLFAHHKREECSKICKIGSASKQEMEIAIPFISSTLSSNHASIETEEISSHVLSSLPNNVTNGTSVFENSLNSSQVFHLTPSVVLGDETLSFIPIDQNGGLSHLVSGPNSQVLSVSENDLNSLINERLHLQSVEQLGHPSSTHGILLTASLISPSGKESNIHIVANVPQNIEHNSTEKRMAYDPSDRVPNSMSLCVSTDHPTAMDENKMEFHDAHNYHAKLSDKETFENSKQKKAISEFQSNEDQIDRSAQPSCTQQKSNSDSKRVHRSKVIGSSSPTKLQRKCEYCGKQFKKLFNLHQHIRSHTGEKPFHCLVCGRGFTQKSNVKKHMQTHKVWPKIKSTLPKEQISIKVKCNGDSSDKVGGDDQAVEYVVNNVYVCQYCDSNFENYHKLKTHLSHVHKQEKLFKCIHKDCLATFLEVEGLISHMKIHESELEYQCQNCPKKFLTLFDLGSHQYCHRLYPNKVSACPPKQFRCSKCNSKYASSEALNHHLLTSSHNYPCSQCRLTFVCERYLRRHLRIHGTGVPFKCQLCGKFFKTENYLKSHLVIHSDNKPFNCETCGAVFNRRDKLTRHKLMHETRKKFKCPFKNTGCTREFYRKDKLKDHMLSHSRKVYSCVQCRKTFSWPTRLRHHQAAYHPEMLASTTCHKCNKIFKTKHHLKIHLCKGPEVVKKINDESPSPGSKRKNKVKTKLDEEFDDDGDEYELGDVQEIVLYTDCDILEEGASNSRDKQDAMLSGLTHQEHDTDDPETIILTRYCEQDVGAQDEMTNDDNSEGVLGSMEITFEATVDTDALDPLMAGD